MPSLPRLGIKLLLNLGELEEQCLVFLVCQEEVPTEQVRRLRLLQLCAGRLEEMGSNDYFYIPFVIILVFPSNGWVGIIVRRWAVDDGWVVGCAGRDLPMTLFALAGY